MNRSVLFLSLLCLSISFTACKSFEVLPPDYEGDSISFGQGGGFVGRETAHIILDNGEVYSVDHLMNFKPFKKLDAESTKQIFSNAEHLGLLDVAHMHPGNTYEFIEIKMGERVKRISWDDQSKHVPQNFLTFFNVLKSYVE